VIQKFKTDIDRAKKLQMGANKNTKYGLISARSIYGLNTSEGRNYFQLML